jgi:hypothetical protein
MWTDINPHNFWAAEMYYAHLLYKCVEKDIKHSMDLFTIKSKLGLSHCTKIV